jgi:hypothetical protein
MDNKIKAVGVLGLIVILAATLYVSAPTKSEWMGYLEDCDALAGGVSTFCVVPFLNEDGSFKEINVLTHSEFADYQRYKLTYNDTTLYKGWFKSATFDWTVEYFRTYGEDRWIRLARKPSKIELSIDYFEDYVVITKKTPYYAYNYASGDGGILVEEFILGQDRHKINIKWFPTRQNSLHRLNWRLSDLENDTDQGITEDELDFWFGNTFINWSDAEGHFKGGSLNGEKMNLTFGLTKGDIILDPSIGVGTAINDWIQHVSTTHSFTKPFSVFKITPRGRLNITPGPGRDFNFAFINGNGLKSYNLEILESTPYYDVYPIYDLNCATILDSNGSSRQVCNNVPNGSVIDNGVYEEWKPFDFWDYQFEKDETYYIKIIGDKKPMLGPNNIDMIPTFRGVELKEYAWWNSDVEFKYPITIDNSTDGAPPLDANTTICLEFDSTIASLARDTADGNDLYIIHLDTTQMDVLIWDGNVQTFNSNGDNNVCWKLNASIDAGAIDQSYDLYISNVVGESAPERDWHEVYLTGQDFNLGTNIDNNASGRWTKYLSSLSNAARRADMRYNDTNQTMDIQGDYGRVDNGVLNFTSLTTGYYVDGNFEFVVKIKNMHVVEPTVNTFASIASGEDETSFAVSQLGLNAGDCGGSNWVHEGRWNDSGEGTVQNCIERAEIWDGSIPSTAYLMIQRFNNDFNVAYSMNNIDYNFALFSVQYQSFADQNLMFGAKHDNDGIAITVYRAFDWVKVQRPLDPYPVVTLGAAEFQPDVNVLLPIAGNYVSLQDGNDLVSFDVIKRDNNHLIVDLYYSRAQKDFETLIVDDLNLLWISLNPTVDANCSANGAGAGDFTVVQTCFYDTSFAGPDGNLFIDVNIFDVIDNNESFSGSSFFLDNNVPIITVFVPAENQTVSGTTPIDINAFDNSGNLSSAWIDANISSDCFPDQNLSSADNNLTWNSNAAGCVSFLDVNGQMDVNMTVHVFDVVGLSSLSHRVFTVFNPQPPDVNIVSIEGLPNDGPWEWAFNYGLDSNLLIDFNVAYGSEQDVLLVDFNYIFEDVEEKWVCEDQNFQNSTRCSWDWNIYNLADGNYLLKAYIHNKLDDLNTTRTTDVNFVIYKVAIGNVNENYRSDFNGLVFSPLTEVDFNVGADGQTDVNGFFQVTNSEFDRDTNVSVILLDRHILDDFEWNWKYWNNAFSDSLPAMAEDSQVFSGDSSLNLRVDASRSDADYLDINRAIWINNFRDLNITDSTGISTGTPSSGTIVINLYDTNVSATNDINFVIGNDGENHAWHSIEGSNLTSNTWFRWEIPMDDMNIEGTPNWGDVNYLSIDINEMVPYSSDFNLYVDLIYVTPTDQVLYNQQHGTRLFINTQNDIATAMDLNQYSPAVVLPTINPDDQNKLWIWGDFNTELFNPDSYSFFFDYNFSQGELARAS